MTPFSVPDPGRPGHAQTPEQASKNLARFLGSSQNSRSGFSVYRVQSNALLAKHLRAP